MIWMLLLLAYPSTFGGKGIYRVKSADIEWLLYARSILVLNVDAEAYRYDYTDSTYDYGSGRVGIAYTPSRLFETYMLWRAHGEGHAVLPYDQTDFTGDLGDLDLGLKFIIKKIRNSYIGADLAFTLPIGMDPYGNDRLIIYPKALMTYDLGDHWRLLPMRFHLNLGVPIGRRGLADNFPLMTSIAFELPSKFFTFFMEFGRNHEQDWNWRFSPGLRFHPFYRLGILIAADLGLNDDYRLLGVNAGISLNSSLTRERETMPTGNIAGEIRDNGTKQPISARIKIIELDETKKTGDYGDYNFLGIPQGVYTLIAEAEDYGHQSMVIVVDQNKTTLASFYLERATVRYQGLIADQETEKGLSGAIITLTGPSMIEVTTDYMGNYESTITPGHYEIRVNKVRYAQYVVEKELTKNLVDTIALKPIEVVAETPEAIVYFDVDDANIREDQREIIDDIGEFLKGHPYVGCELRGHTDPSGDMDYNQILSLARANSVKDYLVKAHGIEKDRISTLAFSKTKLIKEKKELSRRVEIFLIK